jgi:hypothetical protein
MALERISSLDNSDKKSGEVATGTLSDSGAQSIFLGGVLTVAANQDAGNYQGDVIVAVEYN